MSAQVQDVTRLISDVDPGYLSYTPVGFFPLFGHDNIQTISHLFFLLILLRSCSDYDDHGPGQAESLLSDQTSHVICSTVHQEEMWRTGSQSGGGVGC